MASYTIELSTLIDKHFPFALNSYPIFNEDYRDYLNNKILRHYYFREIGAETPDRFNFYLETRMNEIMPYYNKLYESELIKFNPLDTDSHEEKIYHDAATERELGEEAGNQFAETTGDRYSGITQSDNSVSVESTSEQTGTSGDTTTENIDSKSTTTNDLQTETETNTHGTGETNTNGSEYEVFSDLPQNQLNVSTTIGDNGSATYAVDGFATTTTGKNSVQHSTTETSEDGTTTSTNTGTVDVVGNSELTRKTDGTTSATGKQSQSTTNATTNKDDNQRNINKNSTNYNNRLQNEKELKNESNIRYLTGRSGQSPSKLLQDLRDTFLNIDMMVINELNDLFMGVF